MRFTLPACALALLGLTAASTALGQNRELGGSGELIEGVAAIVDDGVVLLSELQLHTSQVLTQLELEQSQLPPEQRLQLPPMSEIQDQLLDQLILRRIKIQRAERRGVSISDDDLNRAISQMAQSNGIAFEDLPELISQQGMDYAEYREDQRNELKVEALHNAMVYQPIQPTAAEVERCLADLSRSETDSLDFNVSHILVALPGSPTAEQLGAAEDRVAEITERLEAGEDFSRIAVTMSDADTALQGGSLGWLKGAQLPSIFAGTVRQMQPGEISDPIRSGSGFHFVRLNDSRGAERIIVDQVRARHILLSTNEIYDDEATEQRLLRIRENIEGGDDFATLARELSEDTESAAEGGDLDWADPNAFVPEFAQKLAELPVGELSEPVQTDYGWHLIEVLDRRRFDTTDQQMTAACRENIRQSKYREELLIWEQQIRAMAYIEKKI